MQLAANTDEPLQLADGSLVYPDGRVEKPRRQKFVEVPNAQTAQRLVVSTRRKLSDLPAPPRTMNFINVVLSYTLMGLGDDEIAIATGSPVENIQRIKTSPAYAQCYEQIIQEIIDSDKQSVRDRFARMAHVAADKVAELIDSEDEQIALAASKDALDRAGMRPADIVQHNINVNGELRIVKVSREALKQTTDVITIDVEGE